MTKIEFFYWRLREKFCYRFHIYCILTTKVGIKEINPHLVRTAPVILSKQSFMLPASDLFLGIDSLTDENTLLDRPISQSPHFNFMKVLNEGGNLAETEYIKRFEKGTLDGRRGVVRHKSFQRYVEKFSQRMSEYRSGKQSPVLVYKIGERFYIYDGKHRAALCAYLGLPILCLLVDSHRFGPTLELMKHSVSYSKHISLHELYNERNNPEA